MGWFNEDAVQAQTYDQVRLFRILRDVVVAERVSQVSNKPNQVSWSVETVAGTLDAMPR